jgi:hypothetical protein
MHTDKLKESGIFILLVLSESSLCRCLLMGITCICLMYTYHIYNLQIHSSQNFALRASLATIHITTF